MKCILCKSTEINDFFQKEDKSLGLREYLICAQCDLVFLKPQYFLNKTDERERYDLHQNTPDDLEYVKFLNRLTDPLLSKLSIDMEGLDFGCGPGPTISSILKKEGIKVFDYDPIYFNDEKLLKRQYDFVTCTETVEHFYHPHKDFLCLNQLLKEQGSFLGVMTQFRLEDDRFKDWWYHREPTHVCFYSKKTFKWISNWLNWSVEELIENVVIFSN